MSSTYELPPAGVPTGLIGDIGGTNCRLALAAILPSEEGAARQTRLFAPMTLKCADFPTPQAGIAHYLASVGAATPPAAALAVAGPVLAGRAHLTNAQWELDEAALQSALGIRTVRLMNDFAAMAFAALVIGPADLAWIGPKVTGRAGGNIAIMGPGTGFGVAALAGGRDEGLLVTEGGHADFAPADLEEVELLRALMHRHGRVAVELVLSGRGLENLHAARAEIAGAPPSGLNAAAITAAAEQGDVDAAATVAKFCDILASIAGNFALAYGAEGGVFIAGGIVPRLMPRLDAVAFRARFEAKGRFAAYLRAIPTQVIMADDGSLRGAARAWSQMGP
jgi:glucokinase